MKSRIYLNLWKLFFYTGWFGGNDFKLFFISLTIYDPELNYGFLFNFQIAKFCIEFGIDLQEK